MIRENIPLPKQEQECHEYDAEKALTKYKTFWQAVAENTKCLVDCWDKREDQSKKLLHTGGKEPTLVTVSDWAEEAVEAWQALEYWAKHPKDDSAQKEFIKKSGC